MGSLKMNFYKGQKVINLNTIIDNRSIVYLLVVMISTTFFNDNILKTLKPDKIILSGFNLS